MSQRTTAESTSRLEALFTALGDGVVVAAVGTDARGRDRGREVGGLPREFGAWLHISEAGTVTAGTGKVEMGQNIRTSLTQAVAEELSVAFSSIRLVMGDTELSPFDRGTSGSRTTPTMAPQFSSVAAAARELLIDLAAERWQVDRLSVTLADGNVRHEATEQSLKLGQLVLGLQLVKTVRDDVPTTAAERWQTAGSSIPKVDGSAFVTGAHHYTSDIRRPGMLYGKVLRPPAYHATLVSVDTRDAEAMEGVTVVRDGDFVGVVAPNEQTAGLAIDAIETKWTFVEQPSHRELFELLKTHGEEGGPHHTQGSMEAGLTEADTTLSQSYTVAYIAHVPLEPRAAVAEWNDGKLTVWTGTQRPFGVRGELASVFDISEDRVRVIMPDAGSGYGGKHTGEAAIEAARLAKGSRTPVKLVWTREEEFTWAYFRPAGVIEIQSGVKADGRLTAWECHNYNSGASAIRPPYEVANQETAFHRVDSPLREGSYRALAATANVFARETHIDELADALKIDPLEFRLKNLKDERLRAVFEAAAERFGWGKSKPESDGGIGIAGGIEKGGYVATCAEIQVHPENGAVNLTRVVVAFECGAVRNPEHLTNQIEGAVMMGIGGALSEAIEFENGKILNPRFSDYHVPRFSDTPIIETVLIDRKDLPSAGGGETPIVAIAPAIGNAIFDATGVRHRSLPMRPNERKI